MPKPDKVLRFRPLKELPAAVSKLKRVVLFHPKVICEELPNKFCICGKGERKKGQKSKQMTQCAECWEWFHFDCVGISEDADLSEVDWKCEWCVGGEDKEGYQRWKSGRKKAKKRHRRDLPKLHGAVQGGNPPTRYSAPRKWEDKVSEVQELARRAAIKKRKLTDAAEVIADGGGHHNFDAEGMAGLEVRVVDVGLVDEMIGAGFLNPDDYNDE